MKVSSVETIIANVPYRRREISSVVARDGVTDVVVKVATEDGLIGWGEACGGADVTSVDAAVKAMVPFVIGRDPWDREAMRADAFHRGLWHHRTMTGNYAWAGIDMALWDLCGKAAEQPIHKLLGRRRESVDYFYYLSHGVEEDVAVECAEGLDANFNVFYIKVGIDFHKDLRLVAAARQALGEGPRLRLDANGAWASGDALRQIRAFAEYDIDFIEQPVTEHPLSAMAELRARSPVPLAANEGLWTEADAADRVLARVADVYCFSPYWVGSIAAFHRISLLAHAQGLQVCKHTHGELGIAAAAAQQVLLALPNVVDGNQQTAFHMDGDVVARALPITAGHLWPADEQPGLGVEVDEADLEAAADRYRTDGQYLPYT